MANIFFVSTAAMLAFFILFGLAAFGIGLLALHLFGKRAAALSNTIPVANFVTAITTAWALSLGFAAADVWSIRTQAEQSATAERSSIARLAGMADQAALGSPALITGLDAYQDAVLRDEWYGADLEPAPRVDAAIQQIRLALVELARGDAPPSLIAKMSGDFDELQDARNQRLASAESSVSVYKWYLVLFLTVLSTVAIASIHADRTPAGRSALAIYVVAAVVSLWMLALHANPYDGTARIDFHAVVLPAVAS